MISNYKSILLALCAVTIVQLHFTSVAAVEIELKSVSGEANPRLQRSNLYEGQLQLQSSPRRSRKVVVIREVPPSSSPTGACQCMDYWECVMNDGQVYSYCGISDTQVCCFHKRMNKKAISNGTSTTANVEDIPIDESFPSPAAATTIASSQEIFNTGSGNSPTVPNIAKLPTHLPFVATSSPSSSVPDVDYFYSLEEGDGDLKRITSPSASPHSSQHATKENESFCGRQAINWNLNSKAEFREWPWHVALLEVPQDMYICGGTLISNDKVVTAAHCVKSYPRRDGPELKIRAGEYDVSTNAEPDPYIEALVEKIVIHPGFNNATLANDIAILKLKSPLKYAMNIRPICLPSQFTNGNLIPLHGSKVNPIQQCVVTGWGRVTENSPFSVLLKEIVVPLWNHTECQSKLRRNFGPSYNLPETAICAGSLGRDACDGDGGGGLVCFSREKQQWEIQGITSYGIGCGRFDNPGVYTSLLPYVQWIDAFIYLQ